jgi:hypothetical protein
MTPEGKVKAKVKALLNEVGGWHVMVVPQGMGRRGIPDFIICHRGHFIAVEAKAAGNKPTTLQQRELDALGAAGASVMVVDSDETINELRELLCHCGCNSRSTTKPVS